VSWAGEVMVRCDTARWASARQVGNEFVP
jgi:hypothetical protein